MNDPQLVEISQSIGRRIPFWIQGAGGNVSVKTSDRLYVKASGARLEAVTATTGIAELKLNDFCQQFAALFQTHGKKTLGPESEQQYENIMKVSALGGRPSMETGFHATLPKKWVMHFHSLAAVLMGHLHKIRAQELAEFLKAQNFQITFIDYHTPGLKLALTVAEARPAEIYILEKHGVLLASVDTKIVERWSVLEDQFLKYFFGDKVLQWKTMNLQTLIEGFCNSTCKEPIPVYMPDTAVFLTEIQDLAAALSVTRAQQICARGTEKEKACLEIYLATKILQSVCPDLSEVSKDEQLNLVKLPTEQYRKGVVQ